LFYYITIEPENSDMFI